MVPDWLTTSRHSFMILGIRFASCVFWISDIYFSLRGGRRDLMAMMGRG